jgi:flagella basal body P-ring formation protein FlgA
MIKVRCLVISSYLSIFLGILCSSAQAQNSVTGVEIKLAITTHLSQESVIGVPKISDGRVFYPCERSLIVSPKFIGKWETVTVKCPQSKKNPEWSIIVRVSGTKKEEKKNSHLKSNISPQVVILLASVKKGEVLKQDIIALAPATASSRLGSFYRIADVLGRRASQNLSAMQPLRARHLEHDWALLAEQPVQIIQRTSGFEISTIGKALDDAQIGDTIRVENIKSGKIISAQVINSKKVTPIANMN